MRTQGSKDQQKKNDLDENKVAADVEFLHLVKGLLLEGRILNLDEAHKSYLNILNDHFSDLCPCRKTVR